MRSITYAIALAGLIGAASHASAEIINLDPPAGQPYLGSSYTQDGFTFTNSGDSEAAYADWLYIAPEYNADTTGPDILANFAGTTNTLTQVGGGAFDFSGISLSDGYNDGKGGDVAFVFNHADGTIDTATVTLKDGVTGLQAFGFNEAKVSSVVFTPVTTNFVQFDFASVSGASVSAVPLPASLPMFGGALLALGGLGFGLNGRSFRKGTAAKTA